MPDTPYSILDNQKQQLWAYYENKEQQLRARRLPRAQHSAAIAAMQSEYDAKKFRIQSMRNQLDEVNKLVPDPTARNEAMWKLVLPQETSAAMFQTERAPTERAPLSPQQLKTQLGVMEKFAEAAPPVKEYWTGVKQEPRKQEDLIAQYKTYREAMGYNNFTPGQQQQLDYQWDSLMRKRLKYKWNPKDVKIKALRPYGSRLAEIAGKKISPFAKSIKVSKPSKLLSLSPVYSYFKRKQMEQETSRYGAPGAVPGAVGPNVQPQKQNLADPLGIR